VRFGRAERASRRDRYRAADVLVFPSVWDEPFGLVPIEAMACGVPVVASGTGGSSEFLADGTNCVLFTRGDHDSLAAALMRLAESTDLRERVVAGGFDTAERLTADRYAGQLFELHLRAEQRSPARGLGS
jgi:glycosyltransferase involved in cell wall biosynthesis